MEEWGKGGKKFFRQFFLLFLLKTQFFKTNTNDAQMQNFIHIPQDRIPKCIQIG